MKFLTALASHLITYLLEKVVGAVKEYFARRARAKQIEKEEKEAVKKLLDAKTAKEIDDAARDALNRM
jgi:hypothetical protein